MADRVTAARLVKITRAAADRRAKKYKEGETVCDLCCTILMPLQLATASAVLGSVMVTDGPWPTLGH
jgi:DNA-binding transcriptional ArsR family regulator